MSFLRFNVLNMDDNAQQEGIDYPILINSQHIASVKPINIIFKGNIIHGYWVRLINGKKYKATKIPQEILKALDNTDNLTELNMNSSHTVNGNIAQEGGPSFQ